MSISQNNLNKKKISNTFVEFIQTFDLENNFSDKMTIF